MAKDRIVKVTGYVRIKRSARAYDKPLGDLALDLGFSSTELDELEEMTLTEVWGAETDRQGIRTDQ